MKNLPHLPTDEVSHQDFGSESSDRPSKVVSALPVNDEPAETPPAEDPFEKTTAIPIQGQIESPFEIVPEDEIIPLNPFAELPVHTAMGQ